MRAPTSLLIVLLLASCTLGGAISWLLAWLETICR